MDVCAHVRSENGEYCEVCADCGLELESDRPTVGSPTPKNANDDFNRYMTGMDGATRRRVIDSFERVIGKHVVRGVGRKALLAACFMYESQEPITSRDVARRFDLERKRFGEGKRLFLTYNKKYRTMCRNIGEFAPTLCDLFNAHAGTRARTIALCERVVIDADFVNFSPYSVCACILYSCMTDEERKCIKKNVFTTRVGMSDKTVDKITSLLRSK